MSRSRVVIGVIGDDIHIVGKRIMHLALEECGGLRLAQVYRLRKSCPTTTAHCLSSNRNSEQTTIGWRLPPHPLARDRDSKWPARFCLTRKDRPSLSQNPHK